MMYTERQRGTARPEFSGRAVPLASAKPFKVMGRSRRVHSSPAPAMSIGGASGTVTAGFGSPRKVNRTLSSADREPSGASGSRPRSPRPRSGRPQLVEEDPLGQRVLDLALDGPAQRPGTQHRVAALASRQPLRRSSVSSRPMSLLRSWVSIRAIMRSTICRICSSVELVEHDRVVDAVEELRPEVLLELVVDLLLHPLVVGLARRWSPGSRATPPWPRPGCRGWWSG